MATADEQRYRAHSKLYLESLERKLPQNKGWKIKRVQSNGKVALMLSYQPVDGSEVRGVRRSSYLPAALQHCQPLRPEEIQALHSISDELDSIFVYEEKVVNVEPTSIGKPTAKHSAVLQATKANAGERHAVRGRPQSKPKPAAKTQPKTKPLAKKRKAQATTTACTHERETAEEEQQEEIVQNHSKKRARPVLLQTLSAPPESSVTASAAALTARTSSEMNSAKTNLRLQLAAAKEKIATMKTSAGDANTAKVVRVDNTENSTTRTNSAREEDTEPAKTRVDTSKAIQRAKKSRKTKRDQTGVPSSGLVDVYTGVYKHFEGLRKGAKGVHKAIKASASRVSLVPPAKALREFAKAKTDANGLQPFKDELMAHYRSQSWDWIRYLHLGYNLLFYGYGEKSTLIRQFVSQFLAGEDVVEATHTGEEVGPRALLGFLIRNFLPRMTFPSQNVLHLARLVAHALSEVFGCEITLSQTQVCERDRRQSSQLNPENVLRRSTRVVGEAPLAETLASARADRYRKAPKLFVVLHGIDYGAWATLEAQACLAALCSGFSGLRLLASVEDPNITACWDSRTLLALRWMMLLVPTYDHLESSYNARGPSHGELAEGGGLDHVLRSLTPRHTEIVALLARQQLEQPQRAGVLYDELLSACRRKMLAQHDRDLRQLLTELTDHKLVTTSRGADGVERVRMILPTPTLEKLRDWKR